MNLIPSSLEEIAFNAKVDMRRVKIPENVKKLAVPFAHLQPSHLPSKLVFLRCILSYVSNPSIIESLPSTITHLEMMDPAEDSFDLPSIKHLPPPDHLPPNLRFLVLKVGLDWDKWIPLLPPSIIAFQLGIGNFDNHPQFSHFNKLISHLPALYSVFWQDSWSYRFPNHEDPTQGAWRWIKVDEQLLSIPTSLSYLQHISRTHPEEIFLQAGLLAWAVGFNRIDVIKWLIDIDYDLSSAIANETRYMSGLSSFQRALELKGSAKTEMLELLLEGLKINLQQVNSTFGLPSFDHLLHYVVTKYHMNSFQSKPELIMILDWFKAQKPSLDFWSACSTSSPFSLAVWNLSWPIVDWMMENMRQATDIELLTALMHRRSRPSTVEHLLHSSYALDLLSHLAKSSTQLASFLQAEDLRAIIASNPPSTEILDWLKSKGYNSP
jgi:hypothetical protein